VIEGKTKSERKRRLAVIVVDRLTALGHTASIVEGRVNSLGHKDRILVDSSLGLIHLTASSNTDPSGSILSSDIEDASQAFLADKSLVAYGWNAHDGRSIVMFVSVTAVLGNRSMTKDQIRASSISGYTKVLSPQV
jgi:hypothetical protein